MSIYLNHYVVMIHFDYHFFYLSLLLSVIQNISYTDSMILKSARFNVINFFVDRYTKDI